MTFSPRQRASPITANAANAANATNALVAKVQRLSLLPPTANPPFTSDLLVTPPQQD